MNMLLMLMMVLMIAVRVMIVDLALLIDKFSLLLIIKNGSLLYGLEVKPCKLGDIMRLVSNHLFGEVVHDLR